MVGQLQPGAVYPLNWPLFLAPLRHGHFQIHLLDYSFILAHFLAALFGYWLCLDLGRSKPAALLGGLAFALSGIVGSIGWPQMLNGAIWAPLVLLFTLRSLRAERPIANAAFAGTFLGVAFLSGHHQIPTFIALMAGGLWIADILVRKLNGAKAAAVFLLFASLVSAAQVWPAIELGKRSIRWVGSANPVTWSEPMPYLVHDRYSLPPLGLLDLVLPGHTGYDVYVGLGILTLALFGFAAFIRERQTPILAMSAGGGVLLALGSYSVFHGVTYLLVPLVEKARTPAMAMILVQLAIATLSAYGLDAIRAREPGGAWVKALLINGFVPLLAGAAMVAVRPESGREYQRMAILGVASLALAALIHGWRNLPERVAIALVFVIVIFELGTYAGSHYRNRESPGGFLAPLEENQDVFDFLRQLRDLVRLEVKTDDVPYNIGDWDGIDQEGGYLANLTENISHAPIKILAANYFIAREPIRPNQQEVFRGRSGLRIFRNPDAFPFLQIVSNCSGGEARLVEKRTSGFVVDAALPCAGTVTLSETYFPGWEGNVDGRPFPIREMFGAIQGVDVAAGRHRIKFSYRPWAVYWGAVMSFAGFISALALAFKRHRPSGER